MLDLVTFGINAVEPRTIEANADVIRDFAGRSAGTPIQNFWGAMIELQSRDLAADSASPHLTRVWGAGNTIYRSALSELMGFVDLPLDWEFPRRDRDAIGRKLEEGEAILASILPDVHRAYQGCVGRLMLARCPGASGGSVSSRVGLIWLGPPSHWTAVDYAENIMHEFIHNALFLDDMVRTLFVAGSDRLGQEDALAISAILRRRRGYDKAFHSCVVAYCLYIFHERLGNRDRIDDLLPPLLISAADLSQKTQFLTPRGLETLKQLAGQLVRIANSQVQPYELTGPSG